MTNREAHEEAAGMGLDPLFFAHNGIDPDAPAKCGGCEMVYCKEYSNGGKQCFGLVSDTHRDCDIIRSCQKYDNGKEFYQDLSLDEAAEMAVGYAAVVNNATKFYYERPCGSCEQRENDCMCPVTEPETAK